jgi:hypothetical protein
MKRLTTLFVVLGAAIGLAIFAPMAAADQPSIVQNDFTQTSVLTGVCSFPITVNSTVAETDRFFTDQSGMLTSATATFTEQDTFTANGNSLTGEPYTGTIQASFDSSGNITQLYVNGVLERVLLPDGSIYQSAGRVNVAAQGFPSFTVTPTAGGEVNLAGFCAALS